METNLAVNVRLLFCQRATDLEPTLDASHHESHRCRAPKNCQQGAELDQCTFMRDRTKRRKNKCRKGVQLTLLLAQVPKRTWAPLNSERCLRAE